MTKFVLLMVLCSGIAGNQCKVIKTPEVLFEDYSSCIVYGCLLYTSPSPRDVEESRMPSSA